MSQILVDELDQLTRFMCVILYISHSLRNCRRRAWYLFKFFLLCSESYFDSKNGQNPADSFAEAYELSVKLLNYVLLLRKQMR